MGWRDIFGPTRVQCTAGVWTTVLDHAFVQMPRDFVLRVEAADGGAVAGTLEERKSRWIIPGTPTSTPLAGTIELHRGYFNTFYRVRVLPERDVVVVVE